MYLHQISTLHIRLSQINKAGKVYLKKTVQHAPSLFNFKLAISKLPITKSLFNSTAYLAPALIVSTLQGNVGNSSLLVAIACAPTFYHSVLNLSHWANWSTLKEQALKENIDWLTLKKNNTTSKRIKLAAFFLAAMSAALTFGLSMYMDNASMWIISFSFLTMLLTNLLGEDAQLKINFLLYMSEDISKFIDGYGMDSDFK